MTDHDLVIINTQVVTSNSIFDGWVAVDGSEIAAVGTQRPPPARRVIDGRGLHLLPGRIEPHCHLRSSDFGDDLEQTSRQAIAGGVTTLMPHMRATESYLKLVPQWAEAVAERGLCDVAFHLQIQIPAHHGEIAACYERFGIQSYKVHIDARRPVAHMGIEPVDDGDVYLAMREVRKFGGIVAVHCEDSEITRYLDEEVRASGRRDLAAWADVRPPIAEAADVNTVVFLAAQLGCRLLIVHVSAAESILAARLHRYDPVTFETLIHQLAIPADDAEARVGPAGKTNPPLRSRGEVDALWTALEAGQIHFVGTDHSANAAARLAAQEGKDVDFWDAEHAPTGIGVGTPLFLTEGLRRGLDLGRMARLMSEVPAETFGMADRKGSIAVGKDADLMLVDLETERQVTAGALTSPGKTLAEGLVLRGWPVLTTVRGQVVFEDGQIQEGAVTGSVISRR